MGREAEMAALTGLLLDEGVRLVTLTGVAGVGKTRLAIEAARQSPARFEENVHFVSLADVVDSGLVSARVLSTLRSTGAGSQRALDEVCDILAGEPCLLLLDNFEHLLDASRVVAEVLERCPDLTVLVTSRSPLGLRAESCIPLEPLRLPPPDAPLHSAIECDAVAFLLSRLASIDAARQWRDETDAVIDICRRLDGLPLALELVASRARTLSLPAIHDGLDASLDLLTRGGADVPDRQRTMRSALEWSYRLLDTTSATVFRRFGVCVGGAGLATVAALTTDLQLSRSALLDALDELVRHGLVVTGDSGRFRMLQVVHEFARGLLQDAGESGAAADRHAETFLDFAEEASRHLAGPQQLDWLDRLQEEAPNLSAALRTTIARNDTERALRFCLALRFLWYVRGPLVEGQAFFSAALALPGAPSLLRGAALVEASALARHVGDLEPALGLTTDAVELARGERDDTLLASALLQQGFVLHVCQRYSEAQAALEESLALSEAGGNALGTARALHHLGLVAYYGYGDSARAWQLHSRCLTMFRDIGHERHEATTLIGMAEIARVRAELQEAHTLLNRALAIVTQLRDLPLLSYALYTASGLAVAETQPSRAVRLLGAAESVDRRAGAAPWPVLVTSSERGLSQVTARLGHARVASLRAQGAALDQHAATELAASSGDDETSPLTQRESEIASLLSEGLSNRAIAARLVLSERTVDGHVGRILSKLGFSSRAQIAVWVASGRPADGALSASRE